MDAAGPVDAQNRAHRALEIASRFPQASTAKPLSGLKTTNGPRLRADEESDDTHATYCVAAFQTFLSGRI